MSIRASDKLRHVATALLVVLGLFAALHAALWSLASAVERRGGVYPWRDEDVLRYLLPGLWAPRGKVRMLIAGPSEAREDLLAERFAEAFPDVDVIQGALSLGIFDDFLLTLEYLERAHEPTSLPKRLILGLTPRFVANIPRGDSPWEAAIDRYSPAFRVEATDDGPRLRAKPWWEGIAARARFLQKQQKRYKAALCAWALSCLAPDEPASIQAASDRPAPLDWMSYQYHAQGRAKRLERALRLYVMPYKYHNLRPMRPEALEQWLTFENSFWFKVHQWNPTHDAAMVRSRMARLTELASQLDIELTVVFLPEHPANRARYPAGHYESYASLVRNALAGVPIVDLRAFLEASEFYDVGHATLEGAERTTAAVIAFLTSGSRSESSPMRHPQAPF